MKYSICISTLDREEILKNLLNTIELYTTDYEVVIYDVLKEGNIPVGDAWNVAIQRAKGEYIQVLNDDMEVSPNWLVSNKRLHDRLEEEGKNPGSIQSLVMCNGQIQTKGGVFIGTDNRIFDGPDVVSEIDYSNFPFFKKDRWEKVGGFTSYGHIYYEDSGFGLKLQKAGYKNYYNPNSVITHITTGSNHTDSEEQKEERRYREQVLQPQSKEAFYKVWMEYLQNR